MFKGRDNAADKRAAEVRAMLERMRDQLIEENRAAIKRLLDDAKAALDPISEIGKAVRDIERRVVALEAERHAPAGGASPTTGMAAAAGANVLPEG